MSWHDPKSRAVVLICMWTPRFDSHSATSEASLPAKCFSKFRVDLDPDPEGDELGEDDGLNIYIYIHKICMYIYNMYSYTQSRTEFHVVLNISSRIFYDLKSG